MSGELKNASIAGPQGVNLRQVSWLGPLASPGRPMALAPVRFGIVNGGRCPCYIETVSIDPLSFAGTGTAAQAQMALQPAADFSAPLPPGASIDLVLSGTIPSRPGSYSTTVRVLTRDGDALAIPVALTVPASPVWGVAAMLVGLLLLGTVNLLAGEGAAKTRLHDALKARQDIHALLESNPPPESRSGDVATMDHDFDAAIAALGARHPLSVVDHRDEDAQAYLAEADRLAATLRAAVAGKPRGAAEIEDVKQDWDNIQPVLQKIAVLPNTLPPQETGLAAKLDAFLLRFRQRMLQNPAVIVAAEAETERGRMALDESAGEGEAARELALTTKVWLRRSALFLNRALTSYRSALVEAGWMLNTDTVLRERAAHDDMAPEYRAEIVADLDQAAAQMDGEAWLDNWKTAHFLVNKAWTAQVRGVTQTFKARVDETIAAVNRQTDTGDIEALMAQAQAAPKPHTPAMKQAFLNQTLALWRGHVAQLDEPGWRDKLTHEIDTLQALVSAGKIMDAAQRYHGLLNDWAALNAHLVERAIDRLDHPRCLEMFADLQRNTAGIEAILRERPPGGNIGSWDRQLDAIRLDMQRDGPDAETVTHDCSEKLLNVEGRVNALSGTMFAATLTDIPLNAVTRVRLAEASGVAEAISATQANKDNPRNLVLAAVTRFGERVVGRTISFSLRGADPVWGSSARVRVYFGDDSAPFEANAEQLRQGREISHEYTTALTAHLNVSASEAPGPGGGTATILGEGNATILVAPSPVTGAQVVADEFLNLRFGLALLISLTVYYWRYQNRSSVFGARGYDYVEAFALGFAANAAVSTFPSSITGLAPK